MHCQGAVPPQQYAGAPPPMPQPPMPHGPNPYAAGAPPPAANPYANVPAVRPPTPMAMPGTSKKPFVGALFGILLPLIIVMFAMSPKACKYTLLNEETAAVIKALEDCPKTKKALGSDIDVPFVGCTTGKSKSGGDSGSGFWSMPIQGSNASGNVQMSLSKRDGTWKLNSAVLTVGSDKYEAVTCKKQ